MARTDPTERVFLDSNVLVYAHSASDPVRRERARAVADLPGAVVSAQVLSELGNVLLRKFALPGAEVREKITEIAARCEVVPVTAAVVLDAFRIRERYRLGFFDSQIVAAALAAGAETLYTEDLHDGLMVDGRLHVVSPFRHRAEQARGRYRPSKRGLRLSRNAATPSR
jgi:predicted nucleic acid-binding protein